MNTQKDEQLLNFFDENYYSAQYMFRKATYEEAWIHYMTYGKYALYNPSDRFCTSFYLAHNLDVAKEVVVEGLHPGIHYLEHGSNENRPLSDVAVATDRYTCEDFKLKDFYNAKIALSIHIFYDDYTNMLLEAIQNSKHNFDIYITSPFEEILLKFVSHLEKMAVNRKVIYKLTPNIGRNFGPMLVEFADELARYDIIGHVHTKKSLYTGQARYDVALNCMSAVLGGPEYLESVFSILMNTDYGLVHSMSPAFLPFWSCHWLKNFQRGSDVAEEINIKVTDGFIDYPVGGMFWARTDAIRQILKKRWKYNDFEDEKGQTDGMLHHAIERLWGACCVHNKFKALKWNSADGTFNNNDTPWAIPLKKTSIHKIQNLINNYDIVSFDIFDTLLYRTCYQPNEIRTQFDFCFDNYSTIRAQVENNVKTILPEGRDVSFMDIVPDLSKQLKMTPVQALQILSDELHADLRTMRTRNIMISLVKYARLNGKRIIFVSDMYYGAAELEYIFKSLAIPKPDFLYVSSEIGLRKDSGELWRFVRSNECGSILHFGDNIISDLQNSLEFGIESIYVPSLLEKVRILGVLKQANLTNSQWNLLFPIIETFGEHPFFS